MRQIKFRAWNGTDMIYKSEQDEYDDYYMLNLQGNFYPHTRTGDEWYEPEKDTVNKLEYSLMQFTGLKDRNDIEIYDGDIIDISNGEKFIVYWDKKYDFCFKKSDENTGYHKTYRGATREEGWIVLGNIYENPELKP